MSTVFSAAVTGYLKDLRSKLPDATELTHRSALEKLIQNLGTGILAASDPKQQKWGKPDFNVSRRDVPLGNIETKDIDVPLDDVEVSEQLKRYLADSANLILTDYLDFRWFVNGQKRLTARIAEKDGTKLRPIPSGVEDLDRLLDGFLNEKVEIVTSAKELAEHMARKAEQARHATLAELQSESKTGQLHDLLTAFRSVLIPDLKEKEFADMFAQTLAYGLFAAWVHARQYAPNKEFSLESAGAYTPKTNPFLRMLFSQIANDLPERVADCARDLVDLLNRAQMNEVLKDFGKGKGKDDPVVHFYETFLTAYDPKTRKLRGVFYTPVPAVSYVVRSIDYLLKKHFSCAAGLADDTKISCKLRDDTGKEVVKQLPRVLVLDIATGTGTFLYYLISYIYQQRFANQQGAWNSYVTEHLLERIFGFELLMAPYAVAHLKLGMLLKDTQYKFDKNKRLGIYLTNTLDEAIHKSEQLMGKWLSDEANEAAEIKHDRPIMVVMGNPPYSKSVCKGKWIMSLVEDYKKGLKEKKSDLSREEWKFLRFAQWRIEQTGQGIVGFVINNAFLDGVTHRRMRQSLMETFNEIHILNLHGSTTKKERAPDGGKDENIFDIKQGVCIALFVKLPNTKGCQVFSDDLWHGWESKYKTLEESDASSIKPMLNPVAPDYFFVPTTAAGRNEYLAATDAASIFLTGISGVKTHRDELLVDFERDVVSSRFIDIADTSDVALLKQKYDVRDTPYWSLANAKTNIRSDEVKQRIHQYLYRPLDLRAIYYNEKIIERGDARWAVMQHMLQPNTALIFTRQTNPQADFTEVMVSKWLVDKRLLASYKGEARTYPLYLYDFTDHLRPEKRPNFAAAFLKVLADKLKLPQTQPHGLPEGITPEDIFHYTYAVFHSPVYRQRYAEFLKIDFPRLPLTTDLKLFQALAEKGTELVALHLLESPKLAGVSAQFCGDGKNAIEKIQYTDADQRVWVNASQYFDAVPKNVWEFFVGGYQPCKKWLDDRRKAKRTLSYDDMQHYRKTVIVLGETIRLMAEVDALIPRWPIE